MTENTNVPIDALQASVDAALASSNPPADKPQDKPADASADKPADAPQDKPQETSFDFTKFADGRFKSEDELKTYLSESDGWKTEAQKAKELEEKLSEYNGYIKPASERVRKLNELEESKGNVELFLQLQPLNTSQMKDVDAVKWELMYKDKLTSEEADREVRYKFKTNRTQADFEKIINSEMEKGELADQSVIQKAREDLDEWQYTQQKLSIEGRKSKEFIESLKIKSEETPDVKKIFEDNLTTWKPLEKFIPKNLSTEITVGKNGDAQTFKFDYVLDKEAIADLNEFKESLAKNYARNGFTFNESQTKDLQGIFEDRIWAKNGKAMAAQMVTEALTAERLKNKAAVHHPESLEEKTRVPSGELSPAEQLTKDLITAHRSR